MAGIFQQVMNELGIREYTFSAYHPESQGAPERWHQTLKNMMRIYCFQMERDWDEGIHLLLFAARQSVQESLGFSPSDVVFGHTSYLVKAILLIYYSMSQISELSLIELVN